MEKRKWLWKRKSSERSPGESEGSESFSSHSERYSDEQEAMRESPSDNLQSPEVTSRTTMTDDELKESVKTLAEKLSAALVNVSAKEGLVKQHAKVAEEAVAGWEKAENEVAALKQQLEAALQQNLSLEVKTSHLDGALKECVRQLRQARDEQGKRISDAMVEKNNEWEAMKSELEKRILDLQAEAEAARAENSASASADPNTLLIVEALDKENSLLKQELVSCCKELEVLTIERDLSTQAAETASKLQLESIKKVAKLEAECRRLHSIFRKSSPLSSQKSAAASSLHAESVLESRSDSGERLNGLDFGSCKTSNTAANGSEPGCSDSWASVLMSELDQFKPSTKNVAACALEIGMMDDFLEMERLAALSETIAAPKSANGESVSVDNPLRAEVDAMIQRVADLENMLEKTEAEKSELQNALDETIVSLKATQRRMAEAELRLEELQKELTAVNEKKESLEFQLVSIEVESRTMSANVDTLKAALETESELSAELTIKCQELENELTSKIQETELVEVESRTMSANVDTLKAELETERKLSAELTTKCQELEDELTRKIQETELEQNTNSNGELKIKQEDLAVAADKLAECQNTIASLGRQLKSLATLEDFLIDTSNIPGFSRDPSDSGAGGELWSLPPNDTFTPDCDSARPRISMENHSYHANGNEDSSRSSSLSSSSTSQGATAKSRNNFGKFFC